MRRGVVVSVVAVWLLAGCVGQPATSSESGMTVQVGGLTADEPVTLTATDAVSQLQQAWQSRQTVMVKIRPDFIHRVTFIDGAEKDSWLYASSGYAVRASEPYGAVYQLPNKDLINRLLGIQR